MNPPYESGKPTASDVGRLNDRINDMVYIDWNVVQFIYREKEALPLLESIQKSKDVLIFPVSSAHLLDATTLWGTISDESKSERYRHMVFADGISSQLFIDNIGMQFNMVSSSMFSEADRRCMFTILDTGDLLLSRKDKDTVLSIEDQISEGKQLADKLEDETSRSAMMNMMSFLEEAYSNDGIFTADPGTIYSKMMSFITPLLRQCLPMTKLTKAHPSVAVRMMDTALRKLDPQLKGEVIMSMAQQLTSEKIHIDDIGPQTIGMMGYFPDRSKTLRKGSPGVIADGSHARFALISDLFITGDNRLGQRVDAWAHYTKRGLCNEKGPIVSVVQPKNRADYQRTAEVIDELADSVRRTQETRG